MGVLMKIAVVIQGLVRLSPARTNFMVDTFRNNFPEADFYFHTWDNKIQSVPIQYHSDLLTSPEPKYTYNPLSEVPKGNNVSDKFAKRSSTPWSIEKFKYGHFQIVGYADAYKQIIKKEGDYDVFVRSRWDCELSTKVDFSPYLDLAMERPVGFCSFGLKPQLLLHELTEQPRSTVNSEDSSRYDPGRWHCFMPDSMIFHSPKHFDPDYALSLFHEKKLQTGEYGWWQVLSDPFGGDIHTSVFNGLHVRRS